MNESYQGEDLGCEEQLLALRTNTNAAGFQVITRRGSARFDPTTLHLVELTSNGGSGLNLLNTQIIETPQFRKLEAFSAVAYGPGYLSFRNDPSAPSQIATNESGNAVVQWSYTWTAFNQITQRSGLNGRTTFTFHADGRIHRDEVANVTESIFNTYLSAFIGLSRVRFSALLFNLNGGPDEMHTLRDSYDGSGYTFRWNGYPTDHGFICAFDRTGRDLLVYAQHVSAPVVGDGLRITESGTIAPDSNSFAFNSD